MDFKDDIQFELTRFLMDEKESSFRNFDDTGTLMNLVSKTIDDLKLVEILKKSPNQDHFYHRSLLGQERLLTKTRSPVLLWGVLLNEE